MQLSIRTEQAASAPVPGHPWYAVRVKSRHEKTVHRNLLGNGFDAVLPLHRRLSEWSDRVVEVHFPIFPGYVFSSFDAQRQRPILAIPGVVQIVGFNHKAMPLEPEEVVSLCRIIDSGLNAEPCPYIQAGQRVVVRRGPLTGTEGILLRVKNKHQLVVSINLLQRSVAVEVNSDWIRPLGEAVVTSH